MVQIDKLLKNTIIRIPINIDLANELVDLLSAGAMILGDLLMLRVFSLLILSLFNKRTLVLI